MLVVAAVVIVASGIYTWMTICLWADRAGIEERFLNSAAVFTRDADKKRGITRAAGAICVGSWGLAAIGFAIAIDSIVYDMTLRGLFTVTSRGGRARGW
ncbi:hypothetical protein GCM10007368_19340 [Isoptericola cucumis]|uniref:Uncharacterized protein n=1 Tax=Isoptericola cucumis TaxID=1776856 RepID=A0ABQ2B7T5_9MICO|nr:hypothetical protein GCM10007368_19340 [Isoptericola cucumis]